MKIVITGSSGLIGGALVRNLRADGHDVRRLVRRAPAATDEVRWNPARRQLDPALLSGWDAVVNLAGVGIGDRRWTTAHKRAALDSRVDATMTISEGIAAADQRPGTLISASAVGFYGDTGDREVDEKAPAGTGFLAGLCQSWEASTRPAEGAGVRVVHLRSGMVLARDGGIMSRIRPLFWLGLGARLGSGAQYWPWVSLVDEVAAIRFALDNDAGGHISGPVNVTGPEPATNAEFTRLLGRTLHRPAVLSVPAFALRVALGEFADEGVLAGQRVRPGVLSAAGFPFAHRTVEDALRWAVTQR